MFQAEVVRVMCACPYTAVTPQTVIYEGVRGTADFRIVGQKVNGKWRDVIANGNTVQ